MRPRKTSNFDDSRRRWLARAGALAASSGLLLPAWPQSPPAPDAPGEAMPDTNYRVGDSYTHRVTDHFTKIETLRVRTVTQVTHDEVIYSDGYVTDTLGNPVRSGEGTFTGCQRWNSSYSVGKHWTTHFKVVDHKGSLNDVKEEVRVVRRESIAVSAGAFDAFVLETEGWSVGYIPGYFVQNLSKNTYWIAPERVRVPIVSELKLHHHRGVLKLWMREELVAYRQA
jgi:hypothetical protein